MSRRRDNEQKFKFNYAVKKTERSQDEIETEFLQFSNPRSKTNVIEIENKKTKRKRIQFFYSETQKLQKNSKPKALQKLLSKTKKKSSLKTILSYLYTFFKWSSSLELGLCS